MTLRSHILCHVGPDVFTITIEVVSVASRIGTSPAHLDCHTVLDDPPMPACGAHCATKLCATWEQVAILVVRATRITLNAANLEKSQKLQSL